MNKYIKKAAFMLVGTLMLSSCSDWLDYEPKDKQTEVQQFSSRAGFYAAVNGAYSKLVSSSLYGRDLSWGAVDMMTKRYYVNQNNKTFYNWTTWNYTDDATTGTAASSIWSNAFSVILNTNVILENIENKGSVLTAEDRNIIKGEMLALRAMMHFDMLRLFGPEPEWKTAETTKAIPYNDKAVAKVYDLLTTKEVMEKVLADLTEAEKLLAKDPVITEGRLSTTDENASDNYLRYRQLRLNYYAVVLLKARAYMWNGDLENALVEAKKIIDSEQVKKNFPWVQSNTLLANKKDPDRVFSTEVLFGIYNKDRHLIYDNNFDGNGLNRGTSFLYPRNGWLTTKLYPSTDQADYRYLSQWEKDETGAYDMFTKFKAIQYDDPNNPPFYAFLMPLMRISEAYYIAAQCVCATDMAKAIEYVNVVKRAHGALELDIPETTKENIFMTHIFTEYLREFIGEGQILFLLKCRSEHFEQYSYSTHFYIDLSPDFNAYDTNWLDVEKGLHTTPPLPASEVESR